MKEYNTTQLSPDIEFERHIFHRDQFSHYLRWSHILKIADINMKVLDWGCGSGNLAEVFYRNKFKCQKYLGIDIRKQTIDKNKEKFAKIDWVEFQQDDLVKTNKNYGYDWDIIVCFEVVEHIGKNNINLFLSNIKKHCNRYTKVYLSTPNYDSKVGAANNHIINNEVGEWTHDELKAKLSEYFTIEKTYGTFASQKDYKHLLNDWQQKMFDSLKEYYDSNLLSVIMAPMFPAQSRNCLYILSANENN